MSGYTASASSKVAAGCPDYPCLWDNGGGKGDVIGIAPPSLASLGSGVYGGGT